MYLHGAEEEKLGAEEEKLGAEELRFSDLDWVR